MCVRGKIQQQGDNREGRDCPEYGAQSETVDNLHTIDPGLKWDRLSIFPIR